MSAKLKVLWSYVVLVVLYAAGTLFIPPAAGTLQKYHVTLSHLRALDMTVILLYAAIWLCALYGFYNLYCYHQLIKKNKDGKSLAKVTTGIGFLAYWLPVSSVFSLYTNYWGRSHPGMAGAIAISHNYLSLLMPLIGFVYIGLGARGLSELAKQRPTLRATNILAAVTILIGIVYVHLVSVTHNRLNSIYHMPIVWILLTLVAPYIYMWFTGLFAMYEIYIYRLKIAGIVYRSSWRLLALGLGVIVVGSIVIQYLTTASHNLTRLSLNWVLLLVYLLLILLAVGYVCIAMGIRNLRKIEEV